MKQRRLTILVNTRYRVIFACLYWKSQGISCGLESGHPALSSTSIDQWCAHLKAYFEWRWKLTRMCE